MCGIAGFIDQPEALSDARAHLRRMLSAIRHRGPDEQGLFFDERVGLANARLSIIDLATGQQPMRTPDGRHVLVFNGEIFNYRELRAELEALGDRFVTTSDTEVLLHALVRWGEGALPKLEGQFAFVLHDRRERTTLMARDRFGERPLFYRRDGVALTFASEIKAIFALPGVSRALSREHLGRLFVLWTSLPTETCFEGIEQLAPGHVGLLEGGVLTTRRYHHFPRVPDQPIRDLGEAVERTRAALERSVELRLRSDVEVGTYSSGGLDSTITTYLAQKAHTHPVRTFAIGFEDAEYDETPYQEEVARHFGTRHHTVKIAKRDIAEVFPEVVWHAETALFRTAPAPMYLLAREVRRQGLKVVLTGEGADEAFLGYDIFKETLLRAGFDDFATPDDRIARVRGMYPYLRHFKEENAGALVRAFAQHKTARDPALFSHEMRFANAQFATRLGPSGEGAEARLAAWMGRTDPEFAQRGALERAQLLEYHTLLHGYLLSSQGDRMSSAWGVEGRCPFLDASVVEVAASIDPELRLAGGTDEKHVLKAAFRDVLPTSITTRPKQPYRAPDAHTFTSAQGVAWIDAALDPAAWTRTGVFEASAVAPFVERMRSLPAERIGPREDHAFVLLLSTVLLHQQFVEALPVSAFERPLALAVEIDGRGT